ncbi:histidine kinase [Christensenellaceae bacterium OttesenSCG-928-K19]|nr:histidine kinase [Christensenellaceae bacterium OttesenSCG-928-K19]
MGALIGGQQKTSKVAEMISDTTLIINISIEIFASILSLVILICVLISDNMKTHINRVFARVLIFNIAVMLSDALAFYNFGRMAPHNFAMNYIGNYSTYLFSYLLIMAFSDYITTYFSTKTAVRKTALHAVYWVCGIAIALSVVALFNGMYFVIDENNVYHRQDWYWLSQALGIIGMLINAWLIWRYRKHLNRMESFALACYIILPVIAVVIQMLVYGLVSVYVASTFTILVIYVGMQAQQAKNMQEKELALSESRVSIMISQIQPHFLYNTLVSIGALCDTDAAAAKEMTLAFSQYLRGNLDSLGQVHPIPFDKELEHVQTYLRIEQTRFEERLKVEFDISAREFMLPSLTLQPIVENAVRYGVTKRDGGGIVRIGTEEGERDWRIIVSDNGVGFDPDTALEDGRTHVGIANVRSRLHAICDGTLEIESTLGVGTVVTISIPKNL